MVKPKYYKYKGKVFKITKSPESDKDYRATFKDGKKIDFGAKEYPEFPGTDKGNRYCARSYGLGKKRGTLKDIKNANTLSRVYSWHCKGKKSLPNKKQVGIEIARKEEFFDSI